MAKMIVVDFKGKESKFNFKKISRSLLYGKKKRLFLDHNNQECVSVTIDKTFGTLIHSGDASLVYIDDDKNYIAKDQLSAIDQSGKSLEKFTSTLDISQKLEKIDEEYILDFECTSLYRLDEENVEDDLNKSLENEDYYKFNFNYYSDFNIETGILLKNKKGFFALIGKELSTTWIDKEEIIEEHFETPETEEIDFEML